MTTHSGDFLDLENPLGGDLLPPLGDGLGSNSNQGSEGALGSSTGQKLKRGIHERRIYTTGLHLSTGGSLPSVRLPEQYQPMVDKTPPKRMAPAQSPDDFQTLSSWLIAAFEGRRGPPAELARYCGVERQNVTKWQKRSIPKEHSTRRKIAEWAQVDYESFKKLIERTEEAAQAEPKKESKPVLRAVKTVGKGGRARA